MTGSTATPGQQQPRWTTGWERLSRTFLRPAGLPGRPAAPLPDYSRMTDDEKRALIVRVDPAERRVGVAASILGVILALYANVPYMVSKIAVPTTVKPKGKACADGLKYTVASGKATCNGIYPPSHYVLPLVVTLVLALGIYVTVRIGRRAPMAFTIIMTGLAFGSLLVLVPYGLAGAWIMLRAWRTQKYGAPNVRVVQTGWTPPAPRGTTRRAKSTGPRSSRRSRKGEQEPAARKPPTANKRYTPKAPPKKKVSPPSS